MSLSLPVMVGLGYEGQPFATKAYGSSTLYTFPRHTRGTFLVEEENKNTTKNPANNDHLKKKSILHFMCFAWLYLMSQRPEEVAAFS